VSEEEEESKKEVEKGHGGKGGAMGFYGRAKWPEPRASFSDAPGGISAQAVWFSCSHFGELIPVHSNEGFEFAIEKRDYYWRDWRS
jgi:hypothetical protein